MGRRAFAAPHDAPPQPDPRRRRDVAALPADAGHGGGPAQRGSHAGRYAARFVAHHHQHVVRFPPSGRRDYRVREAASGHVGGLDAGGPRRQSGGRAGRSGRAHHQRPGSQSDRPQAGGLPFGGLRLAGVPGARGRAGAHRGSVPAQLPDPFVFRQEPVALRARWRNRGCAGQRQHQRERGVGPDARGPGGRGHCHAADLLRF
ncbi:hypothetical protein D9M68_810450 [compost metagenome]